MSDPRDTPVSPTPENGGIYKDREREDIRRRLVSDLENLRGSMQQGDLKKLLERISAEKSLGTREGLDSLRASLREAHDKKELSSEALAIVENLIRDAREYVERELSRLKEEMKQGAVNPMLEYEIKKGTYISERLEWIQNLENSRLGESVLKDLAGLSVGVVDSAYEILRTIILLAVDLVKLPVDIVKSVRK